MSSAQKYVPGALLTLGPAIGVLALVGAAVLATDPVASLVVVLLGLALAAILMALGIMTRASVLTAEHARTQASNVRTMARAVLGLTAELQKRSDPSSLFPEDARHD